MRIVPDGGPDHLCAGGPGSSVVFPRGGVLAHPQRSHGDVTASLPAQVGDDVGDTAGLHSVGRQAGR